MGASNVVENLLPEMEKILLNKIEILLPEYGNLSYYESCLHRNKTRIYKRYLPSPISRLFETLASNFLFSVKDSILVLGDIPLRIKSKQVLFLQNSLLLNNTHAKTISQKLNFFIQRLIFKFNLPYVDCIIIQTEFMKDKFTRMFPNYAGKVEVIPQSLPKWVKEFSLKRSGRKNLKFQKLRLFYPASLYAHKNHDLIFKLEAQKITSIQKLVLTIPSDSNGFSLIDWVDCVGVLDHQEMIEEYKITDGLFFLSLEESFGLPLLEAMHLNVPIICPDLPYSRNICGDQAIYFKSNCMHSLNKSIELLQYKLDNGWWPDWTDRVDSFPSSWGDVALKFTNTLK
jgi:glycosyltransferase involved in cell wall biosynthesis